MLLTGLSDSDNIMSCEDRRQTVCLDRSRHLVSTEFDVAQHNWVEPGIFELKSSVS